MAQVLRVRDSYMYENRDENDKIVEIPAPFRED